MPEESTGDAPIVEGNRTIAPVRVRLAIRSFGRRRMIGCLCGEVGANRRSFLGSARPPCSRICGRGFVDGSWCSSGSTGDPAALAMRRLR